MSYLGNVVGGNDVKYINVPIGVMKRVAMDSIDSDRPVWFGSYVVVFERAKHENLNELTLKNTATLESARTTIWVSWMSLCSTRTVRFRNFQKHT